MKDNNEGRLLIDIPADGNYIEILGYRIDGFESFEAFLEHLKKYAELEEAVKRQNAYIEMLRNSRDNWKRIATDFDRSTREAEEVFSVDFDIHSIKAEAVKEFAEKVKSKFCNGYTYLEIGEKAFINDIDNLVKEMVGE